ncbi:MAG: SDR family oxidoreductase [Caldithrix sp.]|nr:SDR family oxidoreductase [Caldithrix sp.]
MFKDNIFENTTIFITGGGSGLGKSMAEKLSGLGANIIIASRNLERLSQTAREITGRTGREVLALEHDVRNYRQLKHVLKEGIEHFGKIDALINNAAGNFISPTEKLSYKAFDTIVDIVLRGTYYTTLAFGKYWIKESIKGTILNIVTTYASTGSGYVVPSSISKAGVLNLTRSLAAEWGKHNIRLNAIAPGLFPTQGAWERLFPDERFIQKMTERIPLKRIGRHEELTHLAAYLLSPYSAYMTGEVITIDGGEWLAGAGEFNFLEELTTDDWDEWKKKGRR